MREYENKLTQPTGESPVFGNWNVIAKAWYIVCASHELNVGQTYSFKMGEQRLVLFRGDDGNVRALDAYCPHLGTDLAIGKVVGNHIQCFFHHWQYNGEGTCVKIPCLKDGQKMVRTRAYDVDERYGAIWVYPDAKAPGPVPVPDELADQELTFCFAEPRERGCHHHVGMINGIDAQHLRTVHNLNIEMNLHVDEHDGRIIDFTMGGTIPDNTFAGKFTRFMLGPRYEYSMRYCEGSIGILTLVRNCRFFRFPWPRLYMLYAYRPESPGKTMLQPIYFTKRRSGPVGWMINSVLMAATALAYRALQDEDLKIYDNIRFSPQNLLPIDQPIATIVKFINRLPISQWSVKRSHQTT